MRIALVNPSWNFEHSIYFGCRDPHLPIELAASRLLLEAAGHDVLMVDGHLFGVSMTALADEVAVFQPDMTVITTAPTYLFWRCAPPELRIPREFVLALAGRGGQVIAVGPHGSVTPGSTLRKLEVDVVVRGECEEVLVALAAAEDYSRVPSIAYHKDGALRVTGGPASTSFVDLPALVWPEEWLERHPHHHHRFAGELAGKGAEVEASRGCPYACTFCAKSDYRDAYRRRDIAPLLAEVDDLINKGARYIYFIDEIFLPRKDLLEALAARKFEFGIQTRIDLWKPELLELLGAAGCVSIEAGVESLTPEGRAALAKQCRLDTNELAARLFTARRHVPFVQANLIEVPHDDPSLIEQWREAMKGAGVWANDPVPLYPYPSSPDYRKLWGTPDDAAWERAHAYYLEQFTSFSDIQDAGPLPLPQLEIRCGRAQ